MRKLLFLVCSAAFFSGCGEEGSDDPADSAAENQGERQRDGERLLAGLTSQPVIETSPGEDWESENWAEAAQSKLKELLSDDRDQDLRLKMGELRSGELRGVYHEGEIVVKRGKSPGNGEVREWTGETDRLFGVFRDRKPEHLQVKAFRVNREGNRIQTKVRFEASGAGNRAARVQQRAVWQADWKFVDEDLVLEALAVDDFEEVWWTGENESWFVPRESRVLGENPSWSEQLARGLDSWLQEIEIFNGSFLGQRSGVTVGDVNGDGLDDLYVPQPSGLPNRLYLQRPDGTAVDVSADSGADWLDFTSSALIVDFDQDGDGDLALATNSGILVLENTKGTKFVRRVVLKAADVDVESLTAVDYDGDGDLDLYLCHDFAATGARRDEVRGSGVLHDSNDGGANVLFASGMADGKGWLFRDVTSEAGLDQNNRRHSQASCWEDYDDDGDQDLYVANDYGHNCLYRNDGGVFREVAAKSGVLDAGPGMSASWADYDRDGDMDLYVGNMFSSAGGRIFTHENFRPWLPENEQQLYRRFVKGNSMFENRGGGTFVEVGEEMGVELARWAWSSVFGDLNNDGWEDVVVANGYVTAPDPGDL